jgi:hypothetical protein
MCIIQTTEGISIDQAEYTYDLLSTYFGEDVDRVKSAITHMRPENDLEQDFHSALPLSPNELQEYTITHKGSYCFWTGKLMFLSCITCFDLLFAVQRLSEFNNNPTAPAFNELVRVLWYLASDVICPLMFPHESFSNQHSVSYFMTPEQLIDLEIANLPTLFTDAELA